MLEQYKNEILTTLKSDEFTALLEQWVAELPELTVNQKTVEAFSAEKMKGR